MEKMAEILEAIKSLAGEKKLPEETIFEAIRESIETATKKTDAPTQASWEVRVDLDQSSCEYKTYRRWKVIEESRPEDEDSNPDAEILLSEARKKDSNCRVGEWVEEEIPSIEFSRIAINHAIPILKRKVQEASKRRTVDQFRTHIGKMVQGVVKRVSRDSTAIDLGDGAEAILPRSDQIPHDLFRIGDTIKALLCGISEDARGSPQLMLDRKGLEMLKQLFSIEVPEIAEGIIEIKAAARIAGSRAKVAVATVDSRIDPVGACVGMRGSRVQAVSNQLCSERIDIILWDENPVYLAANAIQPAEVINATIDVDRGLMNIAVPKDDLPQAIGRNGENVKLVEQLTGMNLDILSADDYEQKQTMGREACIQNLIEKLDVEEEIATLLFDNQFETVEDIAEAEVSDFRTIEEFGEEEELVEELRERAQSAQQEEITRRLTPELVDLLKRKRMPQRLVERIISAFTDKGIRTIQGLADLSTYELQEVATQSDFEINDKQAGDLIIEARRLLSAEEAETQADRDSASL